MKKPRVLITTYQSAFLRPGGGEAELKSLASTLNKMGINTDVYGSESSGIDAYDVILHFSVLQESYEFVKNLKLLGKKILIWPNLWWTKTPNYQTTKFVSDFLELADTVIFKSNAEKDNVYNYLNDSKSYSSIIVPWHIDQKFDRDIEGDYFQRLYNLDKYILWVGVIEKLKNQHIAIEALKDHDIPLVFIGGHRDPEYFNYCRDLSSENVFFIPYMEEASEILRSAYKGCTLYMELSSDPAGLSAIEAAIYQKPIIIGDNTWSRQEFGEDAYIVDPTKKFQIISAVSNALDSKAKLPKKQVYIKKHLSFESLNPLIEQISIVK